MSNTWSGDGAITRSDDQVVIQECDMADFVGGIKHIGPSYPVKPVQPAQKDREANNDRRKRQQPETDKRDDASDDDKPTIDEHV